MNAFTLRGSLGRLLVVAFATPTVLTAQTAPPPPAGAERKEQRDVITLEAFDVTAEQIKGYRAATSATATGIGAKIMDIPLQIDVLTKDFLDDTFVTEMREALEYVPGMTTTPRNESEYGVRGFTGNISYRNGQYRRQNYTAWNMDRVEVIKGPAAVFFGSVRDGGVINYMTTRAALDRKFTDLTATVGSEDYYKAGFFHNLPVSRSVALRFGAGFLDSKGKALYDFRRENYYGLSALWKISANQQLVIDTENVNRNNYMRSSRGYAMTNSRFLYNPAIPVFQPNGTPTTTRQGLNAIGLVSEPTFNMWAPIFPDNDPYGRYYAYSPDSYEKFKSYAVDLEYTARIGKHIAWQTMLNWGYDDQPGMRSNNGDQEPLRDGRVRFRFQSFDNFRQSYNAKNKLTWKFNVGTWSNHTLQAGFDYQEVVTRRPGSLNRTPATAALPTFSTSLLSDFIVFNPKTDAPLYGYAETAKAPGQVWAAWNKVHEYNRGAYIVNQSHLFSDRFHLLYGIRQNKLRNSTTTFSVPVTNGPGDARPRPTGWTPQVGFLVQPRPDISLFVVQSRSMEPQFQIDADGQTADPRETTGVDVGFKTAMMNGRLSSSVTYFTLEKTNLTSRDTARELATGNSPYYIYGNAQKSRGIDASFNLSPLDRYQVVIGWSHMFQAKVIRSTTPALIGRALGWTPLDKVTMWNRYQFSEGPPLVKGLTLGLGLNYTAGARISGDPNIALRTAPYTVFDFMAAQEFTVWKQRFKTQLNVKNVADKEYRTGSLGMFAPERQFMLTFSTRL